MTLRSRFLTRPGVDARRVRYSPQPPRVANSRPCSAEDSRVRVPRAPAHSPRFGSWTGGECPVTRFECSAPTGRAPGFVPRGRWLGRAPSEDGLQSGLGVTWLVRARDVAGITLTGRIDVGETHRGAESGGICLHTRSLEPAARASRVRLVDFRRSLRCHGWSASCLESPTTVKRLGTGQIHIDGEPLRHNPSAWTWTPHERGDSGAGFPGRVSCAGSQLLGRLSLAERMASQRSHS